MSPRKKNTFKKIIEEPAVLLEEGVEKADKLEHTLVSKKPFRLAQEYWNTLGPGLITGASDDDPSGIATYSQTGAQYGFQLLWLAAFTFPLMSVVQEMCARIGLVTGHGLAANIRHHYPRWVLYATTGLLIAANAFNIGADLGAMAKGVQLVWPDVSFVFLVALFASVSLLLQIFTTYARYAKILKYLALVLFAYVASALLSHLDWRAVSVHAFVPSLTFSKSQVFLICAILGTTISPYLFFWQTAQEVEEETLRQEHPMKGWHQSISKHDINRLRTDVWSGMLFSNLVMFFIIAASAATLFTHGVTTITTAADAAAALRPIAGEGAFLLFAIGIVGTGMLTIPVLAGSASYALSESLGWKYGLYRKLKEAYAFYGVIILSMLLGLSLNFIGLDPIKTLIYSAVANGIIAPIVLIFIVQLSSNKRLMREHTNGPITRWLGWITVFLMTISSVAAIAALFT